MSEEIGREISRNEQGPVTPEGMAIARPTENVGRRLAKATRAEQVEHRSALDRLRGEGVISVEEHRAAADNLDELYGEISPEEARDIMGGGKFLGSDEVERAFGFSPEEVPAISFSKEELERAAALGQILVLRADRAEGEPLSMAKMDELFLSRRPAGDTLSLVVDGNPYLRYQDFYGLETPSPGWALISSERLPETDNRSFLDQMEEVSYYLTHYVFKDRELPQEYQDALEEFAQFHEEQRTARYLQGAQSCTSQDIATLKLVQLTRPTAADLLYDTAVAHAANGKYLFSDDLIWSRTANGDLFVEIGKGAGRYVSQMDSYNPAWQDGCVSASISRRS